MIVIVIFILALTGFALLAGSMAKHHRDLFGTAISRKRERGLRVRGWLLLGASLCVAIVIQGVAIGLVFWVGSLTVTALLTGLSLTYRDRWWRV